MSEEIQDSQNNNEATNVKEEAQALGSSEFFHEVRKSRDYHAGAGLGSLLMAVIMLLPIYIFYQLKVYSVFMISIAIMMLIYNEGRDSWRLFRDLWISLTNSGHITENAQEILILGAEIQNSIKQHIVSGLPLNFESKEFTQSRLLNLVKYLFNKETPVSHDELDTILASHYFQDTDDQYSQHINTLEFISNVMPLWGIIGTLVDLVGLFKETDFSALDITSMMHEVGMAMQSTLLGVVVAVVFKIMASRFKKRRTAFEFDFEALMGSLKIIWHKES